MVGEDVVDHSQDVTGALGVVGRRVFAAAAGVMVVMPTHTARFLQIENWRKIEINFCPQIFC